MKGFTVGPAVGAGGVVVGSLSLQGPANVRLVMLTDSGVVQLSPFKPFQAGKAELQGVLPKLEPGTYQVAAVVSDGTDEIHTSSIAVTVDGASSSSPRSSPVERAASAEQGGGVKAWVIVSIAIVLAVAAGVTVALRAGPRGRHVR